MRSTQSFLDVGKVKKGDTIPSGGGTPTFSVRLKKFWRRNREGWMFTFPLALGLGIFTLYPMIQSLIWSFFEYTGVYYYPTGLKIYISIFSGTTFWRVFGNTCFYTFVNVPIILVVSYLLASLVNLPLKAVGGFRVAYYLPCVIPGVVSGLLWQDIFSANGIFNQILAVFGAHSDFFSSPETTTAIGSIFLMNLWSVGGGMILWLSAFKAIPTQLYEAAKIDGAGTFQRFLHVTIPMSMPMIFFNAVTMLIGTFQYNGALTFSYHGRGEQDALYMLGVYIYNQAFGEFSRYGYASALSWILLLIVGAMTAVMFAVRKKLYMGDDN